MVILGKKQRSLDFLRDNYRTYPSLIDNKQRQIDWKQGREKKNANHCCRVSVNMIMLVVLMVWLPLSHNTQAEYYLHSSFLDKIEAGTQFDKVNDAETFYQYEKELMKNLFYPDVEKSTYDTSEGSSYAKVIHMGKEGLQQEAIPELFLIGKACIIQHRAPLRDCVNRVKEQSDPDIKCTSTPLGLGQQSKQNLTRPGIDEDLEWFQYRS